MKIIEQNSSKLKLRESAGCLWLLGFFFIAIAGIFVAGLSGLFTNLHELSELEKLGGWVVSLSGVAAGIWVIYIHPGVYVSIDKSTATATVHRKGLLKNETETYKMNEVKDIVLDKTIDSEGDPFYRIALKLKGDKLVLLFSTGLSDREIQQQNADLIKSFLQNS